MAVITAQQLTYFKSDEHIRRATTKKLLTSGASERGVFLSHSHLDRELVLSVVSLVERAGVPVYVDWLDDGLPEATSSQTANKLRNKIRERDRFIVLGTQNGLNSKWVPWELGYADGVKDNEHIAILPINARGENWVGNEYMGVYQSIELDGNSLVVVGDGRKKSLVEWLR